MRRDSRLSLGEPALIALGHRSENPECLLEQAVQSALDGTLQKAEALLRTRLRAITLADLAAEFQRRRAANKRTNRSPCHDL
jgi:hypothetical protein